MMASVALSDAMRFLDVLHSTKRQSDSASEPEPDVVKDAVAEVLAPAHDFGRVIYLTGRALPGPAGPCRALTLDFGPGWVAPPGRRRARGGGGPAPGRVAS